MACSFDIKMPSAERVDCGRLEHCICNGVVSLFRTGVSAPEQ
ncbi:hypothetical protein RUM_09950 [Ruminococcus champanellensis 18P13 = JCM 17042]|uniref:Uncharacterized protein n=1 Tax=Ruminococcus champanellensis (strain DSM 18848 / JCM 17042 / KCTC 15320 / 18P13) TaxID=213810 RepID=D4LC17_RUMC1|nr:hypothetical protein RUM_09950 [Ruminococcus champanellensis 18P13 = JCM 17042]